MSRFTPWVKMILYGLGVILASFATGLFIYYYSAVLMSNSDGIRYTSVNAHISFDLPRGWDVTTDTAFKPDSLQAASTSLIYTTLLICPSGKALVMEPKPGVNNCIEFTTKPMLLYPPDIGEGLDLYRDLKPIISNSFNSNYNHFYVVFYQSTLPSTSTSIIQLEGLYREEDQIIALDQDLCANNAVQECINTFERVLDSISFVPLN